MSRKKRAWLASLGSQAAEIEPLKVCLPPGLPPQDPNSDALGLKILTSQFKRMIKRESREFSHGHGHVVFNTASKPVVYKGSVKWRVDGS